MGGGNHQVTRVGSEGEVPVTSNQEYVHKREIAWLNVVGFVLLHIGCIYGWYTACVYAKMATIIWMFMLGLFTAQGVSLGGHRFFTHRSFKATWPVRLLLVFAHTVSAENCLFVWVRDHRQHHKYSDTDADPHNSTRGFFFSHIGWLMVRKHPLVIAKGKEIDLTDLLADPIVMFQKKYYKSLFFLCALILPMMVPILFWQETVWVAFWCTFMARIVVVWNITWLVNSAAHLYGTRPFNRKIQPVESNFVSAMTFGEGWHNYHHTFPWDYRAAELGSQNDFTTRTIDWLASKGWVYDRKQAPQSMVNTWAVKYGDGSHPAYGEEYSEIKVDAKLRKFVNQLEEDRYVQEANSKNVQ